MDQNDRNAFGCPLSNQTGETGVRNFANIVSNMPPELRRAFEQERAARQRELERLQASAPATLLRRVFNVF